MAKTKRTPDQAATPPEALMKGRFSLFETPDGGYHLSYRPDGEDTDQHVEIPGVYVKLMRRHSGSRNPLSALRRAMA